MKDVKEILKFNKIEREVLWKQIFTAVEEYINRVDELPVACSLNVERIRALIEPFNFDQQISPHEVVDFIVRQLSKYQVHTSNPRYFGLFNPAPTTYGIAADTLVAAFNPQLAAWSHSPFAVEIESHLIRLFSLKFGYKSADADGIFTSGGAEANHTALLTALTHHFTGFAEEGLRSLQAQPILYVSGQSHHSVVKAARFCGLGTNAVRDVPIDSNFRMDASQLQAQIRKDRNAGLSPFLVIATAGTTNAGIIDPIAAITAAAAEENIWCHVDAAWGGAAILVPELNDLLSGIENADSITFDAHKWLSVPMSAGIYLTRHPRILSQTCAISTDYMPKDARQLEVVDPFSHSLQWSRRFTGLKVFMSLAVAGWEGYIEIIRHQVALGNYLRQKLKGRDWEIINRTPLPVICFRDAKNQTNHSSKHMETIADHVVSSGKAWISTTKIGANHSMLRACITNFQTTYEDLDKLIEVLEEARYVQI